MLHIMHITICKICKSKIICTNMQNNMHYMQNNMKNNCGHWTVYILHNMHNMQNNMQNNNGHWTVYILHIMHIAICNICKIFRLYLLHIIHIIHIVVFFIWYSAYCLAYFAYFVTYSCILCRSCCIFSLFDFMLCILNLVLLMHNFLGWLLQCSAWSVCLVCGVSRLMCSHHAQEAGRGRVRAAAAQSRQSI